MVASYLSLNPHVAQRLSGVIYSAPFWGIPDFAGFDETKKLLVKLLAPNLDELLVATGTP